MKRSFKIVMALCKIEINILYTDVDKNILYY